VLTVVTQHLITLIYACTILATCRWAELTAAILLNHNIPVYLFSKVCPTPFVPFTVLLYKCAAGVMVTASHNPKEDNGYKVYWKNGAQVSGQY
jgi:phosphoglucomutase/phosphopentomutase